MKEGVYSDAFFVKGMACVAVVRVIAGQPAAVHTAIVAAEGSNAAEVFGIKLAQEVFPNMRVFNDNMSACDECGATWIPREDNWFAHDAAHFAYRTMLRNKTARLEFRREQREFVQSIHDRRMKSVRRQKSSRRHWRQGGRGVIPAGQNC